MKIKSLFFKVPEPKLKTIKNVTVYISEKYSEIIIAPIFKDTIGGYSYEQEVCEKLDLNTSYKKISYLDDKAIEVGGLLTGGTPLSHSGYFKTADVIKMIAEFLKEIRPEH